MHPRKRNDENPLNVLTLSTASTRGLLEHLTDTNLINNSRGPFVGICEFFYRTSDPRKDRRDSIMEYKKAAAQLKKAFATALYSF
jgi:hypothetical protein